MRKIGITTIFFVLTTLFSFAIGAGSTSAKKATPIELNTSDFLVRVHDFVKHPSEWNYVGDKPAIIDFHAAWCGPCKQLAPTLDALAAEYGDDIYIYKVDVDKEPEIARAFGIQSVPSLLFVPKSDEMPQMGQGNIPKKSLKKVIDEFLLGKKPSE